MNKRSFFCRGISTVLAFLMILGMIVIVPAAGFTIDGSSHTADSVAHTHEAVESGQKSAQNYTDPTFDRIDQMIRDWFLYCSLHGVIDVIFGPTETLTEENFNKFLTELFDLGEGYNISVDSAQFADLRDSYAGLGDLGVTRVDIDVTFTNIESGESITEIVGFHVWKAIGAYYAGFLETYAFSICGEESDERIVHALVMAWNNKDTVVSVGNEYSYEAIENWFRGTTGLIGDEWSFYIGWYDEDSVSWNEGDPVVCCLINDRVDSWNASGGVATYNVSCKITPIVYDGPTHEHTFVSEEVEPTCAESGGTINTCSVCGKVVLDVLPSIGHEFSERVHEPTCNLIGETVHRCSRCDFVYYDNYVNALGHDYDAVVTDPTCTARGFTTHTCSRCGNSYVDSYVAALGHDYDALVTDPTCTAKGFTTHTCSRCGNSYVDSYVAALGHDFGEWTVTTEPTCTENGKETRYCSRCDVYETRLVDALGHDFGEWAVTTEPTCTENGEETHYCSRCDEYETRPVDSLGHDYDAVVTEPTCTEQGFTTHTCSRCNDSYVDTYVDALGHNWSDWTIVSSPTCENDGYSIRICGRCSETENKSLPALGHDWDDGVVTTPATNLKDGVMTYTCSICGETREEVIPKTGKELIDTSTIFKDVKSKSWFKKAVDFVFNNGLMNGMTEDTFAPNEAMSRAMLVTVLWRAEGSPAPAVTTPFTDLKAKWYKDAVAWAYENEIVKGMTATTFDPNAPLSREQIAAIMYRYSEYRGADVSGRASLDGFPDGAKTHNYAKDAMSWAVYEGLISGTKAGDKVLLDPRGNATRAQVATILMRYLEG